MNRALLDTNAYIAFKCKNARVLEALRFLEEIHVTPVVIGELLVGFTGGSKESRNRRELRQFLNSPRVRLSLVDDGTAEFYSHIFLSLKARGTPIPTNDLWIAASALQHGLGLISLGRHFAQVAGLIIIDLL